MSETNNKHYTVTPVAESIPFDNDTNGFVSDNVQDAIEEAKGSGGTTGIFNILTHFRNAAGTRIQMYERTSGTHIDAAPLVVVDNNGDVVAKGP